MKGWLEASVPKAKRTVMRMCHALTTMARDLKIVGAKTNKTVLLAPGQVHAVLAHGAQHLQKAKARAQVQALLAALERMQWGEEWATAGKPAHAREAEATREAVHAVVQERAEAAAEATRARARAGAEAVPEEMRQYYYCSLEVTLDMVLPPRSPLSTSQQTQHYSLATSRVTPALKEEMTRLVAWLSSPDTMRRRGPVRFATLDGSIATAILGFMGYCSFYGGVPDEALSLRLVSNGRMLHCYIGLLRGRGLAGTTIHSYLCALHGVMEWLAAYEARFNKHKVRTCDGCWGLHGRAHTSNTRGTRELRARGSMHA
jgi:hypothetical protein